MLRTRAEPVILRTSRRRKLTYGIIPPRPILKIVKKIQHFLVSLVPIRFHHEHL